MRARSPRAGAGSGCWTGAGGAGRERPVGRRRGAARAGDPDRIVRAGDLVRGPGAAAGRGPGRGPGRLLDGDRERGPGPLLDGGRGRGLRAGVMEVCRAPRGSGRRFAV
ncbi:hypothetical protein GCM10010300_33530 [Streptomyces olivaceoviridis]|nr:hypothetical protein GCM10010300_33530 [Streptomyces olivaceoviridis]